MNALVQVGGIRVASRTSAFRARKDGSDLAAIARALSVGHVLEGSVRTSGTRLRVTAQLTDVASGYQLWSERFDREADRRLRRPGRDRRRRRRRREGPARVRARAPFPFVRRRTNLEAYRSYLKGRHLRGIEDFGGAIAAFEEAVRLDPAHAPSWTGLAEITVLAAHMGMIPPRAACASARKMLATAKRAAGRVGGRPPRRGVRGLRSNADGTRWRQPGAGRSSCSPITSSRSPRSGSPSARASGSTRRCLSSSAPAKPIRSRPFLTSSPAGDC